MPRRHAFIIHDQYVTVMLTGGPYRSAKHGLARTVAVGGKPRPDPHQAAGLLSLCEQLRAC